LEENPRRFSVNTIFFSPEEFAGAREEDLLRHIEEHKYLANQTLPYEISMEEAYDSWNLLVYSPLSDAIDDAELQRAFSDTGRGELFLWVSRHWHHMKRGGSVEVSAREAVLDFGARFAHDAVTRFGFFLQKLAS
jgi:hypothetical protein